MSNVNNQDTGCFNPHLRGLQMSLLRKLLEKRNSLNIVACTCWFRIYLRDRIHDPVLHIPAMTGLTDLAG